MGASVKPMADLGPDRSSAGPVLCAAALPGFSGNYKNDTRAPRHRFGQCAFQPLVRHTQRIAVEIDGYLRLKPTAGNAPLPIAIQHVGRRKTPLGTLLMNRAC